jgi:hypothetical protein
MVFGDQVCLQISFDLEQNVNLEEAVIFSWKIFSWRSDTKYQIPTAKYPILFFFRAFVARFWFWPSCRIPYKIEPQFDS